MSPETVCVSANSISERLLESVAVMSDDFTPQRPPFANAHIGPCAAPWSCPEQWQATGSHWQGSSVGPAGMPAGAGANNIAASKMSRSLRIATLFSLSPEQKPHLTPRATQVQRGLKPLLGARPFRARYMRSGFVVILGVGRTPPRRATSTRSSASRHRASGVWRRRRAHRLPVDRSRGRGR